MRTDAVEATLRRRNIVRTILFLVILGTIPFYILGFILWGTAPAPQDDQQQEVVVTATNTALGSDFTATPTIETATPRPTNTPVQGQLPATPLPFVPPPTRFLSPTPLFVPTFTPAPTLTPVPPTNTPIPPTNTNIPAPPPAQPTATATLPLLVPPTDTPSP